jgi:hypothetical protein
MIAPIAISPAAIAAIPPVAFRLLSTGVPAASLSTVDGFSSIVDLSATGQVLSAVSATRNRLAVLQETPDDTSSEGLLAEARSFVDTVNALRSSVTSLPTVAGILPGSLPGTQLSATANNLASTALAAAGSSFAALRNIGIAVQASPSPITEGAGLPFLSLDENVLLATGAADPAGTRARLDQAALALAEQLTGFESQVASSAVFQAGLTQLGSTAALSAEQSALLDANARGVTVSSDLLQRLPADAVLNDIRLNDLDLAATGVDAMTLLAEAGVTPAADLLASTLTDLAADIRSTAATNLLTTDAAGRPVAAASPPNIEAVTANPAVTIPNTAAPTNTGGAAANQGPAPALPTVNADAIAAERRASAATLALQNLLANPATRAFDIFFDPAYSALIAAAHMGDFVARAPVNDPKSLAADFPGPVLPVTQVRPVEGRF